MQQNAVVITEKQAQMIFACLDFCRSTISDPNQNNEDAKDLTDLMRLFVWRD